MIIKYKKSKFINEEYEFDVEDTRNCFLQGQSEETNITEYFGIYVTNKYLLIVTIEGKTNIKIDYYNNKNVYTTNDIIEFLRKHNRVETITQKTFRNKLDRILEFFEE